MTKRLLFFFSLLFLLLIVAGAFVTASYPLFYDADGREVDLNSLDGEDLSGFDFSTVYIPKFLLAPFIPNPVPGSDLDYLDVYGCVPSVYNNCVANFWQATHLRLDLKVPADFSVQRAYNRVLECKAVSSDSGRLRCLNEIGINVTGFKWEFHALNKEGDLAL